MTTVALFPSTPPVIYCRPEALISLLFLEYRSSQRRCPSACYGVPLLPTPPWLALSPTCGLYSDVPHRVLALPLYLNIHLPHSWHSLPCFIYLQIIYHYLKYCYLYFFLVSYTKTRSFVSFVHSGIPKA